MPHDPGHRNFWQHANDPSERSRAGVASTVQVEVTYESGGFDAFVDVDASLLGSQSGES